MLRQRCLFSQLQLQWKNGQQGAKQIGGPIKPVRCASESERSVAFFPQLQLQWKNGQQGANQIGGPRRAVRCASESERSVAFFPS
jgi:hypothetical protein